MLKEKNEFDYKNGGNDITGSEDSSYSSRSPRLSQSATRQINYSQMLPTSLPEIRRQANIKYDSGVAIIDLKSGMANEDP